MTGRRFQLQIAGAALILIGCALGIFAWHWWPIEQATNARMADPNEVSERILAEDRTISFAIAGPTIFGPPGAVSTTVPNMAPQIRAVVPPTRISVRIPRRMVVDEVSPVQVEATRGIQEPVFAPDIPPRFRDYVALGEQVRVALAATGITLTLLNAEWQTVSLGVRGAWLFDARPSTVGPTTLLVNTQHALSIRKRFQAISVDPFTVDIEIVERGWQLGHASSAIAYGINTLLGAFLMLGTLGTWLIGGILFVQARRAPP